MQHFFKPEVAVNKVAKKVKRKGIWNLYNTHREFRTRQEALICGLNGSMSSKDE